MENYLERLYVIESKMIELIKSNHNDSNDISKAYNLAISDCLGIISSERESASKKDSILNNIESGMNRDDISQKRDRKLVKPRRVFIDKDYEDIKSLLVTSYEEHHEFTRDELNKIYEIIYYSTQWSISNKVETQLSAKLEIGDDITFKLIRTRMNISVKNANSLHNYVDNLTLSVLLPEDKYINLTSLYMKDWLDLLILKLINDSEKKDTNLFG